MIDLDALIDYALSGEVDNPFIEPDAVTFLESFVYDPDAIGGTRTIELHEEVKHVIRTMTARDDNGFLYSTWIYSAPKKSAKTTNSAGLGLWWAWQVPNGHVYIVANDLKQADSRMFRIIKHSIEAHPVMRHHAKVVNYKITLSNGTIIEAIPCDPKGEAGLNPTAILYTEAWGLMGNKAEQMWSEMALSPTRVGNSFKLVESYAGYSGQSTVLERLYKSVVEAGQLIDAAHEIYTSATAIAYWCTRRFLWWQTNPAALKYYQQEADEKTADEYSRIHDNRWISSQQVFVPYVWWQATEITLPTFDPSEAVVMGVDAAVSGDTFAIVGVTRRRVDGLDHYYKRFSHVFVPPPKGTIDYEEAEKLIKALCQQYYVACVAYDPHQLHDMMTRLTRQGVSWFYSFNQGAPRLTADKMLYDVIKAGRLWHEPSPIDAHIKNANAKLEGDGHKLRIVKRNEHDKIDGAVALSMAVHKLSELAV